MSIEQFGKFIAEERKSRGMTQDQFAATLGVSGKAVSKWERGLNYPDIELLEKLSTSLNVSIAELLKGQRNVLGSPISIEEVDQAVSSTLSFTQRLMNKQRRGYYTTLVIVGVLTVSLLTIIQRDLEPPVIYDVTLVGDEVRIQASDDKGKIEYLVTSQTGTPDRKDVNWTNSNIIPLTLSGVYDVWVKDSANHLVKAPSAIIFTAAADKEQWIDQLVMHLQWRAKSTGKVTVNSVLYDLDQIRRTYGDLYWFAEPLSPNEIRQRGDYLIWWSTVFPKEGQWDPYTGLEENAMVDVLVSARINEVLGQIRQSKDPLLAQYASLIRYDEKTGRYTFDVEEQFDCRLSILCIGKESWSSNERAMLFYIRYFAFINEKRTYAYQELGISMDYYWEKTQ